MSGGGSGGGGGSSGTIDYPGYMKERHGALYDAMKDSVAKAQSGNPYNYVEAWNPSYSMFRIDSIVECWYNYFDKISPMAVWNAILEEVPDQVYRSFSPARYEPYLTSQGEVTEQAPPSFYTDTTELDNAIDAAWTNMCEKVRDEVIPKYRRGMQDIGAVSVSAFKIGEALLWRRVMKDMAEQEAQGRLEFAKLDKQVKADYAKAYLEHRLKLGMGRFEYMAKYGLLATEQSNKGAGDVLQFVLQKLQFIKDCMHYAMEGERMSYSAFKEYTDSNNIYKIEQIKWDLEMYKYLMDSLGSIASSAGTSYTTSASGGSRTASAIGGALTGVATGIMASGGNPIGAMIGGAAGLIGGII